MRYHYATAATFFLFLMIPITSYSQTNEKTPAISEETSNRAKEYFDVLSQITMSLNGTKCDQIQRDIRSVNTPQNRMKMDFDLSSLPGAISQKIANQYQSNIQAYREANNNYLTVCKSDPLAAQANADLHELFKSSVTKADATYEKMKAEADKAMAEANRAKAEADKARAEADRAKAEADSRRAQADKARAETQTTTYKTNQSNKSCDFSKLTNCNKNCINIHNGNYNTCISSINSENCFKESEKRMNNCINECGNKWCPK